MINTMSPELQIDKMQLNTLTLERNTVLVARLSRDSGYDLTELQSLRDTLKAIFPNHLVFVWWDDIDFMAIQDNSYNPERMSLVNDSTNYY